MATNYMLGSYPIICMQYTIHRTDTSPVCCPPGSEEMRARWNSKVWQKADTLLVDKFHPQSSTHRPKTETKLLYDEKNLYVMFRVEDQYVKAVYNQYQDPVCNDSCVEFFVMPTPTPLVLPPLSKDVSFSGNACHCEERSDEAIPSSRRDCFASLAMTSRVERNKHKNETFLPLRGEREGRWGYFNFEINCCGTMLLYYVEDPRRTANGFEKYEPIKEELISRMTILHSIPGKVEVEIETPLEWYLEYNIPFSVFEVYLGPLDREVGVTWKGNFYKCGDQTSHPHWASWTPIGNDLNFHQPDSFGILEFGS